MTDDQRAALDTLMAALYPRCRARGDTLTETITMAAGIAARELGVPIEAATRAAREVAAARRRP